MEEKPKEKKKMTGIQKFSLGCFSIIGLFILLIFILLGNSEKEKIVVSDEQMDNAMKEIKKVLDEVNNNTGQNIFTKIAIVKNGARCEITVSDIWYSLPQQNKERTIEALAKNYAHISARHGLRGAKPNEANYPTTSLVDEYGKEVAYRSTLRMKIIK